MMPMMFLGITLLDKKGGTMTVRETLEMLGKYPLDAEVTFEIDDDMVNIYVDDVEANKLN